MAATLFEKICSGEIPADIVYQDDLCVCFRDISPQAPEHLLLVPRKPIPRLSEAGEEDAALPACQALSMPVRYTHEKIAGRTGELAGGREKIQR